MQGNAEVASSLYESSLRLAPSEVRPVHTSNPGPWPSGAQPPCQSRRSPRVSAQPQAYANLALLERGAKGRARLETALRLRPEGAQSGGWWAALQLVQGSLSAARGRRPICLPWPAGRLRLAYAPPSAA